MRLLFLTKGHDERLKRATRAERHERAREVDTVGANHSMNESSAHEVLRGHLQSCCHVGGDSESTTVTVERDVRLLHRLEGV